MYVCGFEQYNYILFCCLRRRRRAAAFIRLSFVRLLLLLYHCVYSEFGRLMLVPHNEPQNKNVELKTKSHSSALDLRLDGWMCGWWIGLNIVVDDDHLQNSKTNTQIKNKHKLLPRMQRPINASTHAQENIANTSADVCGVCVCVQPALRRNDFYSSSVFCWFWGHSRHGRVCVHPQIAGNRVRVRFTNISVS